MDMVGIKRRETRGLRPLCLCFYIPLSHLGAITHNHTQSHDVLNNLIVYTE
jgi:hypothetical protein